MNHPYRIYEAADGFRWHVKADNGEIVAESGEAYDSASNVERAILSFDADAVIIREH
jgi:uncharacterized protein YegP (UPF0339 family)